jgi:hypothetical protein
MTEILATQDIEIRRIDVQSQSQANSLWDLVLKIAIRKSSWQSWMG